MNSGSLDVEGLLDIFGNGRIDIIVLSFGTALFAGITRIVMILSCGAGLQFSAAGHLYFLGNGFLGFHLRHTRTHA